MRSALQIALTVLLLSPFGCSRYQAMLAPEPQAEVATPVLAVPMPPDLPDGSEADSVPTVDPIEPTIALSEHQRIVTNLELQVAEFRSSTAAAEMEISRLTASLERAWTANDTLAFALQSLSDSKNEEAAGVKNADVLAKLTELAESLDNLSDAGASNARLTLDRLDAIADLIVEQPPPTPIDTDAAKWIELAGMVRDGTIPSAAKLVEFVDSLGLQSTARIAPIRGKSIEFTAANRGQWADWLSGAGPIPSVATGPKHVVIVYETADSTVAFGRLRTGLRTGEAAAYLLDKGHSLTLTDDDPGSSVIADKLRAAFQGMELPAILILDESGAVIHKETLTDSATPDSVISILKANGG